MQDVNEHHPDELLRMLADFRFELRQFLQFSENAAEAAELHPQQHQLLLQVAGVEQGVAPTIAYAAKRLCLRHHSVVELVNRSERQGWIERAEAPEDRRKVLLKVTRKGERILRSLSDNHARELHELAPRLMAALEGIRQHRPSPVQDNV